MKDPLWRTHSCVQCSHSCEHPDQGPGIHTSVNAARKSACATLSDTARKLFAIIVHEVDHGPLHSKPRGTATPPEILEACGLDVGEFYILLEELKDAGLIRISNSYPFEEIELL